MLLYILTIDMVLWYDFFQSKYHINNIFGQIYELCDNV